MRSEENQNPGAGNLSSPTESTTLTHIHSDIIPSLSQTARSGKMILNLLVPVRKQRDRIYTQTLEKIVAV